MKKCYVCGIEKDEREYYEKKGTCKVCLRERSAKYRKDNPEKMKEYSKYEKRKEYFKHYRVYGKKKV